MKKDSLIYIYMINWFSSLKEFFITTIINVVFISTIVGTFMDLCPWWLNLISGFAFLGNIHLCVRKAKLKRTWPYIAHNARTEDIVLITWRRNYRVTWLYENFIIWYTPRKGDIWVVMVFWFVLGVISVGFHIAGNITVITPTIIFAAWGILVFGTAIILGIDKLLTFLSMSTIKEILHERGINYHSMQDFINAAKAAGFQLK